MKMTKLCPLLGIAMVLASVGCEDDPTAPAGLTEAEAEALFDGIMILRTDRSLTTIYESEDSLEIECPGGGRLHVSATSTGEVVGDTLKVTSDATAVPVECVVSSGGYTFSLTGNPNLRIRETLAEVPSLGEALFDGTKEGTIDWELENRNGTCDIDLVLDAAFRIVNGIPAAVSGGWTGTMCGLEVDIDLTLTLLLRLFG